MSPARTPKRRDLKNIPRKVFSFLNDTEDSNPTWTSAQQATAMKKPLHSQWLGRMVHRQSVSKEQAKTCNKIGKPLTSPSPPSSTMQSPTATRKPATSFPVTSSGAERQKTENKEEPGVSASRILLQQSAIVVAEDIISDVVEVTASREVLVVNEEEEIERTAEKDLSLSIAYIRSLKTTSTEASIQRDI